MKELISIKNIIYEYIQDVDSDEPLDEVWLSRIASDTLDEITSHKQMEHKVALLEVDNYHTTLPDNFAYIIQIAYRGIEECEGYVKRLDVAQWVTRSKDCDVEVNVKCDKCHVPLVNCTCDQESRIIIDADELFRNSPPPYLLSNANPHLVGGYGNAGLNSKIPSQLYANFQLIRPSQHSFSNADYHVKGCLNLNKKLMSDTTVEYQITKDSPRQIRVNREKGQILVAYFAAVTDEDGFRKVPNEPEYINVIKWAMEEKVFYRAFRRSGNQKDMSLYQNALREKIRYSSKVRDLETIPNYHDFTAFWRNQMSKIYPNFNSEYNFYKQENDRYWSINRQY
jgi:hypothetical protein